MYGALHKSVLLDKKGKGRFAMALFTMCARFATWRRLGVLLALPLLVQGTGRNAIQVAPHAQPALLPLAVQHPRATVRVIVERTRHASGTYALVARLG